ncbi:hypothetical protein [Thalassococcus lentus]|uniref:Uncharacterized protein n=1 Tax=Thalassococcus lentus TaxID=1210524 RepID=A0ABT4XUJ1_9RHOB|nr:hypothetical protein [Thalassococcus lentus]MDA7425635.1 hypothetical protein [Thalassococcus lentus]
MTTTYEELLVNGLADALRLSGKTLKPVFSELPKTDAVLFSIFDRLPDDQNLTDFSTVFGQILTAQQPGMMVDIAEQNYAKPQNWLTKDEHKIAKYTPDRTDITTALQNSPSISFQSDAQDMTTAQALSQPPLTSSGAGLLPKDVNWTNTKIQSFSVKLAHASMMPIRQGGWFTPGVFASAYKNKDWVPNKDGVTWDSVFGPGGSATSLSTNVLVGAGLDIELTVSSRDKTNLSDDVAWPFSQRVDGGVASADLALTISLTTPADVPLLLAIEVQPTAVLFG